MAAAAEDTLPEAGCVEDASKFAAVVWDRFSLSLLNAQYMPREQFVHLIHELGIAELAMKIAGNLKVCLPVLWSSLTGENRMAATLLPTSVNNTHLQCYPNFCLSTGFVVLMPISCS